MEYLRRLKISESVKRYFKDHPEVIASMPEKRRVTALKYGSGKWMIGKKHSEETKQKMSESRKGEKCYRWIKDRTKVKKSDRSFHDPETKQWRKKIWLRDGYKCKIANPDCKGRIEAHHILRWAEHPELRYDINNGITLCHFHHPRKKKDEIKLSPYFKDLVAPKD